MMMAVLVVKLQPLRWKRIHCVFYELEVIFCERELMKNKNLRIFWVKNLIFDFFSQIEDFKP